MERSEIENSVLIVEDNSVTRKMLHVALEAEGYRVWGAGTGQEALQVAQARRPNIIVQDLMLPDMDGFDLVKRLRALPSSAAVPVLCYSSLIGAEDRARVLAAGFTDLVLKPAAPAELIKVVGAYIQNRPAGVPGQFIGRHILVVDDDPALRKLTALLLEAAGARVSTAENGKDALSKMRAELPDAVLSDVLMPESDGFSLCLALRHNPAWASIPIVLMSSQYVDPEDLTLAQRLGANALVVRSSDMQAAVAALTDSLTEIAPPPAGDPEELQAAHLERIMHQLQRQISAQARAVQTQTLHEILTGFLDQIAQVQAHGGDLGAKLDEVLTYYLDACGYPTGAMYLFEADGELVPHALCGVPKNKAEAWLDFFHQPAVLCRAMERNAPTALSAADPTVAALLRAADAETMVLCPLHIDRQALGILVLCSKRQQLDPEWLALAQAAAQPISQTIAFARTLTALTASEQRFRGVAESLADGIVIADEQGKIVYLNATAANMFGYTIDALRGSDATQLTPLLATRAGLWTGRASHRDGHQIPVNGSTAVVLDPDRPNRLTYTHVVHDLSAQEHMEELRQLANHDPLTQALNRRVFEEELKTRLDEAVRYGVHGAVLVLDLDHFKLINDRLGHAAGDAALVTFADVLRSAIRQTDMLARLGGDEFAILAPYANAEQAQAFATKLLLQLSSRQSQYNGEPIRLSASIGIALYDKRTAAPAALLNGADRALYQAKQAGRGCYRISDAGTEKTASAG